MVTVTTIGFGDRAPTTAGGRTFVVFYAVGGIVLLALVVNSIRYGILEDLHRLFAIRAKERKAQHEARRMERREQRIREEENRLRLQETLEGIRQMESAAGVGNQLNSASSEDTQNHSRHFTHLPRHFSLPHGNHMKLPAIFSRASDNSASKSTDGVDAQGVQRSDSALGEDPQTNSIEMLRTDAEHKFANTGAIGGAQIELLREEEGITFQDHPLPLRDVGRRLNADDDLLRYATLEPRSPDDHDNTPWWRHLLPFKCKVTQATIHIPTFEERREADRRQAYREMMKEYQARLLISAIILLTFWLVGAITFKFVESWGFGSSLYFVVITFTTIGYGDLVPSTKAGQVFFLPYCLLGIVTLTSFASLIAEALSKRESNHAVETQLRRVEGLEALEDEQYEEQDGDLDQEQGEVPQDSASEDDPQND